MKPISRENTVPINSEHGEIIHELIGRGCEQAIDLHSVAHVTIPPNPLIVISLMLYSLQFNFSPEFLPARLRKEKKMTKLLRSFLVSALMISILSACSLFGGGEDTQAAIALATPTLAPTTIELTVQADATILTAAGQVINYNYTVKNTGTVAVPGIIVLTNNATCPTINTVGNQDGNLDPGESVACTSQYTIVQADFDAGSVTNTATAIVNGINSNLVTTTISKAPPAALNLTKTANPVNYDQLGQMITYTYVIMNSGTITLGPAQFSVTDSGFSTPINCGDATASLAPTATLTCAAVYAITQADLDTGSVTTNATASGGGAPASPPASVTLTKGTAAVVTPPANPNLTAGSTIQHKVVVGEWLWQIARCYGADPAKTIQANPQLADPRRISPDTIVTVPNIGSAGRIYGPPCVGTHTVQAGETWASIAQKYNADALVLQIVNGNDLTVGRVLKVPLNSAGVAQPAK